MAEPNNLVVRLLLALWVVLMVLDIYAFSIGDMSFFWIAMTLTGGFALCGIAYGMWAAWKMASARKKAGMLDSH